MRKIKKEVRKFLDEFHLDDLPTCNQLEQILKNQGFIIVYFNPQHLSEYVQDLADRLELQDAIQKKNGFTYCNKQLKFVFVNQTLNDENKARVLLHEEIHIYLGHFESQDSNANGEILSDENAARTFAVLVQQEMQSAKIKRMVRIIAPTVAALSLAAILIFRACSSDISKPAGNTLFTTSQTDVLAPDTSKSDSTNDTAPVTIYESDSGTIADPDTRTYYWTQSGTVYHIYADCGHLKNSIDVQSGSKDQSNKERCCKTCYSRYLNESHGDLNE